MKVLLTGGTGFIGSHLIRALSDRGDTCTVVSRSGRDPWHDARVRVVQANPKDAGPWQEDARSADAVINLAGDPLVEPPHRWTDAKKAEILASRVETTRNVVEAIRAASAPPILVSGSAVDYYGDRGDEVLEESSGPGSGFLSDVVIEWEQAARRADTVTRVVTARTGFALGADGGALPKMLPPFKLGIGGPWGSGEQWWPWIHIADVVGLLLFAVDHEISGAINVTAPEPVRVQAFARALGHALRRPAIARAPEVVLRMALGEAADVLLNSKRVVPRRALDAGYVFRYADLDRALSDAVN